MFPIGQIRNHAGIFIVWMGGYIKHALGLSQLQQLVVLLGGGKGLPKT
jgi:hypothetical protein